MTYSEHLVYRNFTKKRPAKPSRLIPGFKLDAGEDFFCPRCGHKRDEIKHGVPARCESCSLCFMRYGNGLWIWEGELSDTPKL